jgi:hypothetical protein
MPKLSLSAPVAFLVFNRPQLTAQVWEAIRMARPAKLLIVADGPRADRAGEAERCAEVRAICEQVDWPCEVLRNYSERNLGCRRRVSSGLDWVFETVPEAIIVEDDCLPHPAFFPYCQELLTRYRDDERVMLIRGSHFAPAPPRTPYSYYFSRYPHIWGWASWRRVWRYYDVEMAQWPMLRDGGWLANMFRSPRLAAYWRDLFDRVSSHQIDTWDYQLFLAVFSQSGLAIAPRVNLVSNIGFGDEATHTFGNSPIAGLSVDEMPFPLSHPPLMVADRELDRLMEKLVFRRTPLWMRLDARAKALVRRMIGEDRYHRLKRRLKKRGEPGASGDVPPCAAVGQTPSV